MAADPYKYFRIEARELAEALGKGALELEKAPSTQLVARILRLAHTLKGAARVVKRTDISEKAHALEELLEPVREDISETNTVLFESVYRICDAIREAIDTLDAPVPPRTASTPSTTPIAAGDKEKAAVPAPAEELVRGLRADVGEIDSLLNGIAEASIQVANMRRALPALENARHLADLLVEQLVRSSSPRARSLAEELHALVAGLEQRLGSGVDQAARELEQVHDIGERLRLLPASSVFLSLERTARDTAELMKKKVVFSAKGGDVRIDAHVLGTIQAALLQAVKNAVAHGIEREGRVEIEVARRGNRVSFAVKDDGRGIDVDAIRAAAQARGLLSLNTALPTTAEGWMRLLLKGGFTTAQSVTQASGRGIGLDVIREALTRLNGELAVTSAPKLGTKLELIVPVSLSSLDALFVESAGVTTAIPLDAVRGTKRIDRTDIARSMGGDSIVHEGQLLRFLPLSVPLTKKAAVAGEQDSWSAVIIEVNDRRAAIGVDRLLGTANLVLRPLPPLTPADPIVSGVSLDADGSPQLVLDAESLIRAAEAALTAEARRQKRVRVLVIDDSLTTRMLEQSILESAGYEVELASTAEEGLEKAALAKYDLFLVDVEMPGIDGYTFVARTRADPVLQKTPAILVTSRGSPEDKKRGFDAGASAYVVKSEFDQAYLLGTIKKLVG
jgi:two-component system chemotaxis sensor kinase CheA